MVRKSGKQCSLFSPKPPRQAQPNELEKRTVNNKESYLLLSTGIYRLSETYFTGIKCHDCGYVIPVIASPKYGMLWSEKHGCRRRAALRRRQLKIFLEKRDSYYTSPNLRRPHGESGPGQALELPPGRSRMVQSPEVISRAEAPDVPEFPDPLWN